MFVHIIRHAQAIKRTPAIEDELRHLTCRGRKRFRRVAAKMQKGGADPDYIFSSFKIRAVQTADILAERLAHTGDVIPTADLDLFTPEKLRTMLQRYHHAREIAIVGHEPDLGEITGELLGFSIDQLGKGSVVTLKVTITGDIITARLIELITAGGKKYSDHAKVQERLQSKITDSAKE